MVRFDPALPYNEILGQPGLAYSQNGQSFNARGDLVTDFSALKPVDSEPDKPSPRDDSMLKIYDATPTAQGEAHKTSNIENMPWQTLKKMVQNIGGEYQSREQAIRFLKEGV